MSSRAARLARGAVAASIALFVAACSHALAGGALPNTAGLALVLAFAVLVSVLLAGKRMSLPRLIASVALSQAMFHGAFTFFGAATTASAGPSTADQAVAHQHSMDFVATAAATPAHESAGMWLAHLVAAAITVLALRFGELAFWGMFDLVRSAVRLTAFTPRALTRIDHRVPLAPSMGELPPTLSVVLSALGHRGPPTVTV